ncbi:MAG: hypothetical protein SGILL_008930 [Bacillariaceae sp.]
MLSGSDTAEASALMKNDRIQVRKEQKAERDAETERKRTQREADREYFKQMQKLVSPKEPDVILDCRGKIIDKYGRNQRMLSTTVGAHSAIVARRCPWLGNIIEKARIKAEEDARKAEEEEKRKDEQGETPEQLASGATEIVDDEDEQLQMEEESRNDEPRVSEGVDLIVDVDDDEDDEDDEESFGSDDASDSGRREDGTANIVGSSHRHPRPHTEDDILIVTLPNHPPEAVKILLEYCCTNRVISLGRDAFTLSCKTKPTKHADGPVAPYDKSHHTKKWPNGGIPRLDFFVAVAAIKLAEEAGLKRLSLMCEIAASQLISVCNVTEALFMSSSQKNVSGNDLPRLRKAAMELILRRGQRGVSEIGRSTTFKKALQEQRSIIVPTLLQGTMETVAHWEKSKGAKKVTFDTSRSSFDAVDRADAILREKERRKRRQERGASDPGRKRKYDSDNYSSEGFDEWETETARRSLKRMRAHRLEAVTRRKTRASAASGAQRTSTRTTRKSRRSRG